MRKIQPMNFHVNQMHHSWSINVFEKFLITEMRKTLNWKLINVLFKQLIFSKSIAIYFQHYLKQYKSIVEE